MKKRRVKKKRSQSTHEIHPITVVVDIIIVINQDPTEINKQSTCIDKPSNHGGSRKKIRSDDICLICGKHKCRACFNNTFNSTHLSNQSNPVHPDNTNPRRSQSNPNNQCNH